jgi:uridine phosphorylase
MPFKESELIITPRGSVYHLDLKPEDVGDYVILVGDPDRVKEVSRNFDSIAFKTQNREFITHTGILENKKITCISTGIGTDNIDIVLNELDAAVNINLETREENEVKRKLNLIRIGTTGSLQPTLEVDEYIASAYVIGLDGLLNYYKYNKSIEQMDLIDQFIWQTGYPYIFAKPYVFKASNQLLQMMKEKCHTGITITAPGFYAPQGRQLRYELINPELIDNYTKFRYGAYKATNLEMEASALYGLGNLLGHEVCTVCAVVANRVNKTFSKDGHAAVDGLIKFVLESIAKA